MSKEEEIKELADLMKDYSSGGYTLSGLAEHLIKLGYTKANQTKAVSNKEISKIVQALGLLNSMVMSGESHSDISRKMLDDACEAVKNISPLPQIKALDLHDLYDLKGDCNDCGQPSVTSIISFLEKNSSLPQALVPIDEQEALNYAEEVCKKCIEISPTTTRNTIALAVAKAFCQRFGQTRVPSEEMILNVIKSLPSRGSPYTTIVGETWGEICYQKCAQAIRNLLIGKDGENNGKEGK